jgi:hypothetical protein
MFVYVRQKNGKIVRVTVPDWDIVNPLAIQPTYQSNVTPISISGIGGDVTSATGEPTDEELLAAVLANVRSRY